VNWLDILLALIIAWSLVMGMVKGITKAGIGFAAMVTGLVLGLWFYGIAGGWLSPYIGSREWRNLAGFFLIFGSVLLLGTLLGWVLSKLFKWARLSWLDRLLGGGFGLIRGILVSTVIILAIMAFAPNAPPRPVVGSTLAPYVVEGARVIAAAAPYELKSGFQRSYKKVQEIWAEGLKRRARKLPSHEI
jgi:membrane protein required for colicin V production